MGFLQQFARTSRNITFNFSRTCCARAKYDLNLSIKGVSVNNYIKHLQKEYETVRHDSRRLRELQPLINILNERENVIENINSLSDLIIEKDVEISSLANEEKLLFEEKLKSLDGELLSAVLPSAEEDECKSIVLEVNTGVGGQEAMLFAGELFEMYCKFAAFKGWDTQIADYAETDIGGIRRGSVFIKGEDTFTYFKQEAGVHRVQRIPSTEKGGRIHTSTVSVIALPQPDDIDIKIDSKDLRMETKKASGAGGQHVNTTESAVRVTHLPTGISVECQVDRSQIKNRQIALTKLKALLYQQKLKSQIAESDATRKAQVRTNFRNEKIRTYNFPQDRITDHRLQSYNVHNLKGFMEGGEALEALILKLDYESKIEQLLDIIKTLKLNK